MYVYVYREQFNSHEPFFRAIWQLWTLFSFFNFCNSFVPDFENLHNLIHLNDDSQINTIFDANVEVSKAEICDGRLKGKFVSKYTINLSRRNLTENLLCKGFNFISTCNKVDVPRLKLEWKQLVEWSVQNGISETIREAFLLNHLKQNAFLTLGLRMLS